MQKAKYIFGSIKWGSLAHAILSVSIPLVVLLFVRLELSVLAVAVVIASKWRVIAVQPRHWLANFRANSPDLIVNLSFIILLMRAEWWATNVMWTLLYIGWLLWLKPQSKEVLVGVQGMVTIFLGFSALFWLADSVSETVLVIAAWFIGLSASRHFLSHFEEPMIRVMSFGWAFFTAQMTWLLNRWLVIYPISDDVVVPQIAVVLTVIAYVLGSLYLLSANGTLKRSYTRQYVAVGCAILLAVIWSTDWNFAL